MKKLFDINEDEKNRILEMHVSATKRHYLNYPKRKKITFVVYMNHTKISPELH